LYVKIKRLNIMSIFVILQDTEIIKSISPGLKIKVQVHGQDLIVNKNNGWNLLPVQNFIFLIPI
jgi:hypothetical protein